MFWAYSTTPPPLPPPPPPPLQPQPPSHACTHTARAVDREAVRAKFSKKKKELKITMAILGS
jgi:hypothetical protein